MEMAFVAEFTDSSMNRDRVRQIIKGKRTKRQRPSSPLAISNGDHYSIDNSDQSPVMSSSTEEDEDIANCLIMLAQSVSPVKEEKFSDQIREKTEKLSSRKLTEMITTSITAGGAKSGFYVYDCKTCYRTFPSFQALGGHRASHKKPKVNVEEKKSSSVDISPLPLTEYSIEDEDYKASMIISNNDQKSPSSSPSPSGSVINHNIKSKVHECSICGSEFLSGQALGGHMRKHRATPPSINRTGFASNSNEINADQVTEKSPGGSSNMLSLDLNFPPPEVVDFQFTASSSSSSQLFSSLALVDCHY